MSKAVAVAIAAMVFFAASRPAFAYFDPSTFWMVLQTLVAVLAGTLLTMKLYWKKLTDWFRSIRRRATTDED